MLSKANAYFLAKFRFDTAENEPAKNLQKFANFLLEKSGRHERFSPGKSAISKVQCSLPFQVRQLFKFSNKKRRSDLLAFGRSAVSPFQDRFVFFRNRSHCGLKWAGEGSGAEAPVLPSCATHPPLPVSGSVFGSCAATP